MSADFRERALAEAARYGPGPWVFVRELLQNARDAGARSVVFEAATGGGRDRVSCRDDGAGMSFEHARRFLFTLYASSKGGPRDAGRFGVGFWSVLRFGPERVTVRSWPRRGDAWQVGFDGALGRPERRPAPPRGATGTEVVLERAAAGDDVGARVLEAARDAGRFLLQRAARRPLRVTVNGVPVEEAFDLPAPRARFRRGRERGVVALGREPRCELFVKGLKVRSASCLGELLASPDARDAAAASAGDHLAPRVLLDGDGLEVLLARGDARSDRALERLVARAGRELGRLVASQIVAARPGRRRWRAVSAAAAAALAAGAGLLPPRRAPFEARSASPSAAPPIGSVADRPVRDEMAPLARPYRDLGLLYGGPHEQGLGGAGAPVALRYSPPERSVSFAAVAVEPGEGAREARAAGAYRGVDAAAGLERAIDVALTVEGAPGWLRLPVPTGHRIDPRTLRVAGAPARLVASAAGEPLLDWRDAVPRVVSYRAAPGGATPVGAADEEAPRDGPRAVPAALAAWLDSVRALPVEERAVRLASHVARSIPYTASPEAVARFRERRAVGAAFADAALGVGAGDCDVQNGLLALLLRASGVPARLVVGYVGRGGAALPGLHAWVEYASDGRWRAADASLAARAAFTEPAGAAVVAGAPANAPASGAEADTAAQRPARAAAGIGRGRLAAATAGRLVAGVAWTLAALLGLSAFALLRHRTRRETVLDPAPDLAALVLGAVRRPEAFAAAPAVFEAPLLPTLARRPASVAAAWRAADAGRLFVSRRGSELARRSAERGACVLDARCAEAAAAADALGACDLDAWDALVARCHTTPLLRAVTGSLARANAALLLAAAGVAHTALLDLGVRALPGSASRALVLGERDAAWRDAEERFASAPARAVLGLAAHVLERLGVPEQRRARRLARLAADALREAGR